MYELIAFIVLSIPILYVSRTSLRAPGSHGFYRFFAWELILGLIVLNFRLWFRDPFSWNQLVSWALLLICLITLIFGVRSLVERGQAVAQRAGEPQLLAFEKTSRLVIDGVYRYIRHPLYSSLLSTTITATSPIEQHSTACTASSIFFFSSSEKNWSAFFIALAPGNSQIHREEPCGRDRRASII